MGWFGKKDKAATPAPLPVQQPSRSTTSTGPISEAEVIAAGQRFRTAIEANDWTAAEKAWHERQDAQARLKGYSQDDGFILLDVSGLKASATFPQPDAIGLPADRVREVRVGLALFAGSPTDAASAVAASVMGLSLPPEWPQFHTERDQWRTSGHTPAMWPAVLVEQDSDLWQVDGLVALSEDARQVLALPRLITRRQVVTESHIAKRTLLPYPRIQQAVAELMSAGFACLPSLEDRLMMLTADQLKAAHERFGLSGKGTKPRLVSELVAKTGDGDGLALGDLATTNGISAEGWAVGLGAGKQSDWLMGFAKLTAHWLGMSLARYHDTPAEKGWVILNTDDCPACKKAPSTIPKDGWDRLPPFHIGCTCVPAPNL